MKYLNLRIVMWNIKAIIKLFCSLGRNFVVSMTIGSPLCFTKLLKKYGGCAFVIDARNGFGDDKEDVEWGFHVRLADMVLSGCRKCIFIMNWVSEIEDEIGLWVCETMKYFIVYKVSDYKEAIENSK